MATAKKLPSGNWRIRVYSHNENGKKKYVSFTAPTKREAELKAAVYVPSTTPTRMSLMDAITEYISLKENVLSPATIRAYKANTAHYKGIGNIEITKLDNMTVQKFINSLSLSLSPKSVKNIYALFTASMAMFLPEKVFRVTLPQNAKRLKKSPSDSIVKEIYDKSKGETKKAIYLAFLGIRRGELCALNYSDIEDNIIHISKDIIRGTNGWELKDKPKTSESERYVLLPPDYKDILGEGSGRIINLSPGTITHNFHALASSFGVDIHLHDMRHYFVSMAHAMGIPDRYIMAMGGFKSDHVMKTVYRNSIDELEKKYREEYAKKISDLLR